MRDIVNTVLVALIVAGAIIQVYDYYHSDTDVASDYVELQHKVADKVQEEIENVKTIDNCSSNCTIWL